jgi:pimeloyl-ACP methyl ester carboxylesterase
MAHGNQFKQLAGLIALLCFSAALTGCHKNAYQPFEIDQFARHENAVQLTFETPKGAQAAFYIPPQKNAQSIPNPLVMVYPGIGAKALDWLSFALNSPSPQAGYLLLDYPGRGLNEGLMRPRDLPQTSWGALKALEKHLHVDQAALQQNICQWGHSFGCAVALQYAQEIPVRRIVLFAPFTTLHKAMFKMMGPLAYLNPDSLDNRKLIKGLLSRAHPPEITIIHGTLDETIPVEMARELALIDDEHIRYFEIPNETHMSILETSRDIAYNALISNSR